MAFWVPLVFLDFVIYSAQDKYENLDFQEMCAVATLGVCVVLASKPAHNNQLLQRCPKHGEA